MEETKKIILEAYNNGNVVFMGIDGLNVTPLESFIKQPTEGILYDLNRGEETIMLFMDDPKWVNDFAVSKVIQALKKRIEELENKKN